MAIIYLSLGFNIFKVIVEKENVVFFIGDYAWIGFSATVYGAM
jgi:hypothetical protein